MSKNIVILNWFVSPMYAILLFAAQDFGVINAFTNKFPDFSSGSALQTVGSLVIVYYASRIFLYSTILTFWNRLTNIPDSNIWETVLVSTVSRHVGFALFIWVSSHLVFTDIAMAFLVSLIICSPAAVVEYLTLLPAKNDIIEAEVALSEEGGQAGSSMRRKIASVSAALVLYGLLLAGFIALLTIFDAAYNSLDFWRSTLMIFGLGFLLTASGGLAITQIGYFFLRGYGAVFATRRGYESSAYFSGLFLISIGAVLLLGPWYILGKENINIIEGMLYALMMFSAALFFASKVFGLIAVSPNEDEPPLDPDQMPEVFS